MIVEPVVVDRHGEQVERSARILWDDGDAILRSAAPANVADASDDASAFLCVALWLGMRRHEDVEIEGPVSPLLLARADEIQSVYTAWDPTVRRIAVRARPRPGNPFGRGAAVFFSRGVDSMFAAARDRAEGGRFTSLVFVDRLEPVHDEAVRAEEIARASAAARRIGLPMVVTESNVREVMDPLARDWEDAVAPGLSFHAHGLAGGLRSALVASGDDYVSTEPSGTSPLLDPLYSTERVTIEHGSLLCSRLQKVEWLTEHRPDLLPYVKVCFRENRPDNCGICGKCLLTMACLQISGGLGRAEEFPDEVDATAVRRMKLPHLKARLEWVEVARALSTTATNRRLRDAILDVLRESALRAPTHPSTEGRLWVEPTSMRLHRLNATLSLVLEGRPYPPLDPPDAGPDTSLIDQ